MNSRKGFTYIEWSPAMKRTNCMFSVLVLLSTLLYSACAPLLPANQPAGPITARGAGARKTIVVTYSILGAIVKDLVGDSAQVVVVMPNGQDPHEWEPSAKDIETINGADMVVQNGLGLEGGMAKALEGAQVAGVTFFTASDFISVRKVGEGEGIPSGDPDQAVGAEDPHLWMDPVDMQLIVSALAKEIKDDLGLDLSTHAQELEQRLGELNQEVTVKVDSVPTENRKLVTGHESMGYFAQRYGFKLVGAIIPSLSSQAEVSASDLANLKQLIEENDVKAIFTELGTSPVVATAIGNETGVKVIELTTHSLPEDGSYFTFMRNIAQVITDA
jgi:zinc/manganese transport system substrate-binding protein